MNDSITLTIPRIPSDLREAARFLTGVADSMGPATSTTTSVTTAPAPEPEQPAASAPTHPGHIDGNMTAEPDADPGNDAAAAFGGGVENPTAATAPAAPNGVDLDSDGLPWDERIHSGSRKKLTKTNQWKKKRGVDDATVAQVEAELRQLMAIPATGGAPAPAPAPEQPAAPQTSAPAPEQPVAPAPPTQPAAPTQVEAPTTDYSGWGWAEFMGEFMKRGMDQSQALTACKAHGLESTAVLATRPDLIPQVAKTLFEG